MYKKKINIIITGSDLSYSIIYIKFTEVFKRYSRYNIVINSIEEADLIHYLPYYNVPEQGIQYPSTAFLSHPAVMPKFINSASLVNCAITMNKQYTELLIDAGIKDVKMIVPGIEMDIFKLRSPPTNAIKKEKLIVGFTGRPPIPDRKSPQILDAIEKLHFIDYRWPEGKLTEKEVAQFYSQLDVIVSPSMMEGGPMAIIEGLAVGVPTIYFNKVGLGDDFKIGTIGVPTKNKQAFIDRIISFYKDEEWLYWERKNIMYEMRNQISDWKYFVEKHDEVWSHVLEKKRQ